MLNGDFLFKLNGGFVGFDAVIGDPPCAITKYEMSKQIWEKLNYATFSQTWVVTYFMKTLGF
jgi:hypothetical protein